MGVDEGGGTVNDQCFAEFRCVRTKQHFCMPFRYEDREMAVAEATVWEKEHRATCGCESQPMKYFLTVPKATP